MTLKNRTFGRLAKVERGGLRDRVYLQIQEMLLAGDIAPGETMPIRALAEVLGTSSMPVREALHQLLSENGIEMLPNRSIRVPVMTRPKLREIRRIRLFLECMAAADAAQKMSRAQLNKARRHNEAWKRHSLGDQINVRESMIHNRELHFTVYQAAELPIAFRLIRSLWLQMGPFFGMIMREMHDSPLPGQSIVRTGQSHDALIHALERRDSEAAAEAIAQDIDTAAEIYLSRIWPNERAILDEAASATNE